ncbi:NDP-sugar pyrophosphorylase family protein [Bradyrhizobium sp. LM3.2]
MTDAPKNAVILAAGCGSRLRPLTDLRPKSLVEVNGTSILHNALRNLKAVGVEEVTIVVGYRKDAIQYACGSHFGELKIKYVESTVFDRTGSAYSLWLARDALLSGDCFLLEGDVFFEEDALRHLMVCRGTDVAAVVPFDDSMEGSAVLLSQNGFISGFRLKQTAANLVADGPQLFKDDEPSTAFGADTQGNDRTDTGRYHRRWSSADLHRRTFGLSDREARPTARRGAMRWPQLARN